jgi:hypothetical protein
MGTISNTLQHHMVSFWQQQRRLDILMQPGWGDAANYFEESDMKYATAEWNVPVFVKHSVNMTAATPSLTTLGEHMQTLEIVSRQWHIPAVTSLS